MLRTKLRVIGAVALLNYNNCLKKWVSEILLTNRTKEKVKT